MAGAAFEGPLAGYMAVEQGQLDQQHSKSQILEAQSLARYHDVQTRGAEQEMALKAQQQQQALQKQKLMQEMWARSHPQGGGQPGQPGQAGQPSQTDQMSEMLGQQMSYIDNLGKNGLFNEADAGLKELLANADKLSVVRKNEAETKAKQFDQGAKAAGQINEAMVGVKDQQSFDMAKLQYMASFPGQPVPGWFSLPYGQAKPLVEKVQKNSEEGLKALKTQAEILRTEAQTKHQNMLTSVEGIVKKVKEGQLKAVNEKNDAAKKAGAIKPLRAPREDVAAISDMMRTLGAKTDSKGKLSEAGAGSTAELIADAAQEKIVKGMSRKEALQEAFDEAKTSGALDTVVTPMKKGLFSDTPETKKTTYDPMKVGKPAAPKPEGDGTEKSPLKVMDDKSYGAVKSGQYYTDPEGNLRRKK